MGRVDEAMRRAGEAPVMPERPGLAVSGQADGIDPQADMFPAEVPGHRHLRNVKVETPLSPRPAPPTPPMPTLPPLLDRLTPGLSHKVVVDREIDPVSREQYRRLATGLHAAQGASGLKVVMVTSGVPNEGKSLTASNLALTLSESYQRSVLLIDGDLRRPSLQALFGLPDGLGLSEGLVGTEDQRLTVHQVSQHLTVLTSGRPTADPMAALASNRMRELVTEARESFDWVVIDTPPIGMLSDASLLTELADGVLLVVKANETPYNVVQRAIGAAGRDRILGVVLNQAEDIGSARYGYDSYYQVVPGGAGPRG